MTDPGLTMDPSTDATATTSAWGEPVSQPTQHLQTLTPTPGRHRDHGPVDGGADRIEVIARSRARHLWAQRHTTDGAVAWAAWRLEVAGILREADHLAHVDGAPPLPPAPGELTVSEALVRAQTVAFIAEAFDEVGDHPAAEFVRELEANDAVHGRIAHDDPTGPIAVVIDMARTERLGLVGVSPR